MRTVKIYGLAHPSTGLIWYVGASGHPTRRVRQHCSKGASKRVRTWIASLDAEPVKTILEAADIANWQERERYWIEAQKKQNPELLNVSDGGYGQAKDGMKRTAVFLTDEQLADLQAVYKATGAKPSESIRRAIDRYLENMKPEVREGKKK